MLTRELMLSERDFGNGRILPDRLTSGRHGHYLQRAEQMLSIYRTGIGETRRTLHRRVRRLFDNDPDCPLRRIDAFCKLLDDAATYARDRDGQAAQLRKAVFRLAAASHPLVEKPDRWFQSDELQVKSDIADALGRPWSEIERELFADVMELHRLAGFDGYPNGRAFLSRYNVAQVQAVLYDAQSMTVWAHDDFKTILRYVKLARLMHSITRTGDGAYLLRLDGPASVLRATRRYGVQMARFLPALIACRNWRMHAVIATRRAVWTLGLDLSHEDGLHSHLPPPSEFDSNVEQVFAQRWGSDPREGWRLFREGEILCSRQRVFVPDFAFRHEDGRTVLLEIVGFWTPEYLQAKLRTLQLFRPHRVILAVQERINECLPEELASASITYKAALHVNDVLARLNAVGW